MKMPVPVLWRLVGTTTGIWLVIRMILAFFGVVAPSTSVSTSFVLLVVGLAWLDRLRAREIVFLRNLGMAPALTVATTALVAITLEISMRLLVRVFV